MELSTKSCYFATKLIYQVRISEKKSRNKMEDNNRRVKIYVVGVGGGWMEMESYENLTLDEAFEAVRRAHEVYPNPIAKIF